MYIASLRQSNESSLLKAVEDYFSCLLYFQGVEDVFEFTVFFVFFALVLLEFLFCFRADYRRDARTSDAWRINGVSERTPLLAASRESSQTLVPSDASRTKRVRLFQFCLSVIIKDCRTLKHINQSAWDVGSPNEYLLKFFPRALLQTK